MKRKRGNGKEVTEEENENICAICCETFSVTTTRKTKSVSYHSQLQRLCASIIASNGRDREETGNSSIITGNQNEVTSKVTPLLCQSCLSQVSAVWSRRTALVGMEVEVRKLQQQILRLLKSLHQNVESFKEEMETVELTIRDSSGKVNKLDEFFTSGEDDGGGDQSDMSGKTKITIKDVIDLRKMIFTAMEGLREFNGTLQILSARSTSSSPPKKRICDEDPSQVLSPSIHTPESPPSQEMEAETHEAISDHGEFEWGAAEDMASEDDEEKPSVTLDNEREVTLKLNTGLQATKRTYSRKKENVDCSENEQLMKSSHEGVAPDNAKEVFPFSRVKHTRKVAKKKKYGEYETEDENDDDNDEDDYFPKSIANKMRKPKKDPLSDAIAPILASIDFTSMTDFKKRLITYSIRKAESYRLQIKPSTSAFDAIDPHRTHFMTYDPTSDTLNLAGFPITIDSEEESVQCSKCSHKILRRVDSQKPREVTYMNFMLHNHILGFHLKLFSCPHCPSVLESYRRFQSHVLGHLRHLTCDICGKPFNLLESLRHHKWSHMNEEEKNEALKAQGVEDGLTPVERIAAKRRTLDKNRFQCSTCGKGFPLLSSLRKHEELHLQERRHILCSNCGKTFSTQTYLNYHQTYVCSPDNSEDGRQRIARFHCDQCPRKFMFQHQRKRHKAIVHEGLPCTFQCSMCEKAFKTKGGLKLHEETHSDARPFSCGKGCVATFKSRSNMKRHEKTCG